MDIREEIEKQLEINGIVNVIIAGQTCSGKTTLSHDIRNYFSDRHTVTIIAEDDYFKNLCDIPRANVGYLTDSIKAFHTTEFKNDVEKLLQNGVVTMPRYDIATNTRICKNRIIRIGEINIFEGLHTISLLNELKNSIKIFVNTDIEICLARRIERDTFKYGIPEKRLREYWDDCIIPMCEKYIFPQKEMADIIINRKGGEFNGC